MFSFILTIVLFLDLSSDSNHDLCLKLLITKTQRPLTWLSIRLVTESLLNPGSIPELAMRQCVLGKDTLLFFFFETV